MSTNEGLEHELLSILSDLSDNYGIEELMAGVFTLYKEESWGSIPKVDPLGPGRSELEKKIIAQQTETEQMLLALKSTIRHPRPNPLFNVGRWEVDVRSFQNDKESEFLYYLNMEPPDGSDTISITPRNYPEIKGACVAEMIEFARSISLQKEEEWRKIPEIGRDAWILQTLLDHRTKAQEKNPRGGWGDLWSGADGMKKSDKSRCNVLTRMGFLQRMKSSREILFYFDPEFARTYAAPETRDLLFKKLGLE